jgi:hypothetical protein
MQMNLKQQPSVLQEGGATKKVSSMQMMRRCRYKVGVNTKVMEAFGS